MMQLNSIDQYAVRSFLPPSPGPLALSLARQAEQSHRKQPELREYSNVGAGRTSAGAAWPIQIQRYRPIASADVLTDFQFHAASECRRLYIAAAAVAAAFKLLDSTV